MDVTADGGQIQAYTHRQPGTITKTTAATPEATALSTRSTITDYTVTGKYIMYIFSANMDDDISCLSAAAVVIICTNGEVVDCYQWRIQELTDGGDGCADFSKMYTHQSWHLYALEGSGLRGHAPPENFEN